MSDITPSPQFNFFAPVQRDAIAELLADLRSQNTRNAYEKDLKDFFKFATGLEPTPEMVAQFLGLDRFSAINLTLKYKSALVEKGLKEATVNRRLASLKSLVNYARKIGRCQYTLDDVKGEKLVAYRDTSGVPVDTIQDILSVPNRDTLKGKRDYAILRLFWDNALRRAEVSGTNVEDFDPNRRRLWIIGKGKGTQKAAIDLNEATVRAIADWLKERDIYGEKDPLFISLNGRSRGHRLTGEGLRYLVSGFAKKAGVEKQFSPHRIRHSSITAALDITDGNVRKVQKLSRHKKLDTLMLYDDNRQGQQGEVTNLLGTIVKD